MPVERGTLSNQVDAVLIWRVAWVACAAQIFWLGEK